MPATITPAATCSAWCVLPSWRDDGSDAYHPIDGAGSPVRKPRHDGLDL